MTNPALSKRLGLSPYGVTTLSQLEFSEPVAGEVFRHYRFVDIWAPKITFTDCNFTQCIFEQSYFYNCEFVNCDFTGARFIRCNLRRVTLDNCKLWYTKFEKTDVPHEQLLRNLPREPNLARSLLRSARINAESIGDRRAIKPCVREELKTSGVYLRAAREYQGGYYRKKYPRLKDRARIWWRSLVHGVDTWLWGHGEYPIRMVLNIALVLALATVVTAIVPSDFALGTNVPIKALPCALGQTLSSVALTFLGVGPDGFPACVAACLALTRYVFLGLFVAMLYRQISR